MNSSFLFVLALLVAVCACSYPFHHGGPIKNLPGLKSPPNFKQFSGFIDINQTYGVNLFYWMTESQNDPSTDPVVMWLTGGPGCSSELAVMVENGPWKVDSQLNLTPNPYSWNLRANLLYVDQPVGTGFSYLKNPKGYTHDETQVAGDMWTFLQRFLTVYPQYAKRDFYIVGESYAGHYVPAISHFIVEQNKVKAGININMKGIGIGNGWVDPRIQYGAYPIFSYENKLISKSQYDRNNHTYHLCADLIGRKDWDTAQAICGAEQEAVLHDSGNINVYNIKLPCLGPLCYNFDNITNYFNQDAVKTALYVSTSEEFQLCSRVVAEKFLLDRIESFRDDIPAVLADGVNVLVYSGDLDWICNWLGGEQWTRTLKWPGQAKFASTPFTQWSVGSTPAGKYRSASGFTFTNVFGAGHMVPMDQPKAALKVLDHVISGAPLDSTN